MMSHRLRQLPIAYKCRRLVTCSTILNFALLLSIGSRVYGCEDDITSVVAQNDADWTAIRKASPNPGSIAPPLEGMGALFDTLRATQTVDLVILIENSTEYTMSNFYLRHRKMVEDLLTYHLRLGPEDTRLAFITFDSKASIVYNGLSVYMAERSFLLSDRGKWQDVRLYNPSGQPRAIHVGEALMNANGLMRLSDSINPKRILLTFTSGNFSDDVYAAQQVELLHELNVTLYSVQSGPSSSERLQRNAGMLASRPDGTATAQQWMNYTWIYALEPHTSCRTVQPCIHNGWCYQDGSDMFPACWCPWGYTNSTCQTEENECRFDVCGGPDNTCFDYVASFGCDCTSDSCGCFCESDECDTGSPMEYWIIILIAISCVVLLAVIILIVLVVLVLRKLQNPETGPTRRLTTRPTGEEAPRGILNQLIVFLNLRSKYEEREGITNPAHETNLEEIAYDDAQDTSQISEPEDVATSSPEEKKAMSGERRKPPPLPKDKKGKGKDSGRVSPTMPTEMAPPIPTLKRKPTPTDESYEDVDDPVENRKYLSVIIDSQPVMPEDTDEKPWSKSDTNLGKLSSEKPMVRPLVNAYAVDVEEEDTMTEPEKTSSGEQETSPGGQDPTKDGYEKAALNINVPRPPSRLPESDLDIVMLPDHVYENLNTCEMEPWQAYVNEVIENRRLEKLCIIHRNGNQYIASEKGFILSQDQVMSLRGMVGDASKGVVFPFRDKWYSINYFTPISFVAVHDRGTEVLCVARSEFFLVVGSRSSTTASSQKRCHVDVDHIIQHLQGT